MHSLSFFEPFNGLPIELIDQIFQSLGLSGCWTIRGVSQRWKLIAEGAFSILVLSCPHRIRLSVGCKHQPLLLKCSSFAVVDGQLEFRYVPEQQATFYNKESFYKAATNILPTVRSEWIECNSLSKKKDEFHYLDERKLASLGYYFNDGGDLLLSEESRPDNSVARIRLQSIINYNFKSTLISAVT